jgi:hypothetical protein
LFCSRSLLHRGLEEDDLVFLLDVTGVVRAHTGVTIAERRGDLIII